MKLFGKINIKQHKNLIFLSAIACLSLLMRALIASYRYVLSKDDVIYLTVAKNLAMGNGLSFDGIHPHLFFPPFYSIISALGFYFFKNLELVSKLNYIFFGGLLCIPLYYLAERIYNRRAARLAAIIMIFLPCWLLSQHMWSSPTEQIYIFFFASAILFLYKAIFDNKLPFFFLSSMLFALMYLTRPEGVIFLLVGMALISIAHFMPHFKDLFKFTLKRKVQSLLIFLITFVIVSIPYPIFLRKNLGHWSITQKLDLNLKISESLFAQRFPNSGLNTTNIDKEVVYDLGRMVKRYTYGLLRELEAFGTIGFFPFYLLVFLGLGLFGSRWTIERFYKEIFLFLFFSSTFFIVALTVVNTRFLMPTLPILVIWISSGISSFEDWLVLNFKTRKINLLKQLPIAIIILSFLLGVVFQLKFSLADTVEYKELGSWVRKNLPEDAKIITRDGITFFYSERETVTYPDSLKVSDILKYGRENNAKYLLVDNIDWKSVEKLPRELEFLLQDDVTSNSFKAVYKNYKYGRKVLLYELFFN